MKASKLPDGYYFVKNAIVLGLCGGQLRQVLIHKVGNQINYFGTSHWDRADQLKGEFEKIDINEYR